MEKTGPQPGWKDQFIANHKLEAIESPELREEMSDLLSLRAGSRDYLLQIKDKDFDRSLTGGDSPKKELIHHIGNTILRTRGLLSGNLPKWEYKEVDPQDDVRLQGLDKNQLIDEFDKTTEELYKAFASGQTKPDVIMPYGKPMRTAKYLEWMGHHETGHEFFLIDAGLILGIPRPQSVIAVWGPGS